VSKYQVVAPCAYKANGRMYRHFQGGAVVELDDDVAAKLGGAVAPVDAPKAAEPVPEPAAATADTAPAAEPEAATDG